jgi:Cdc6-like AAA superfamily ATPase
MAELENVPTSMNLAAARAKIHFFRNLDATIAGFGDGHVLLDNEKTPTSIDGSNNGMEQENKVEIEEGILKKFSPAGLEDPFKQLYSIIFPALYRAPINSRLSPLQNNSKNDSVSTPSPAISSSPFKTLISSSSAAILMGVKGSGKTLLLERVLAACREQLQHCGRHLYRMVEINGIVCRGEDVASVVYEIIRQLSGIAYRSIRITKKSKTPVKSIATSNSSSNPDKNEQNERIASSNSTVDNNDSTTTGDSKRDTNSFIDIDENRIDNGDDTHDDDKTIVVNEDDDKKTRKRKRRHQKRKQRKIEKHMLRLRQATFNSNLALLESILKLAAMDDIPILLNLDELDSFTDEGERQMLLYHFLDRVATPGSNLILIGMTSSFSALTLLEKRIRSRAEGTAKIIYLRTPPTYQALLGLLEHKLKGCLLCKDILDRMPHPKDAETVANALLSKQKSNAQGVIAKDNNDSIEAIIKISNAMEREFRLGRDIRWFSRVIATSLTLYRNDCIVEVTRNATNTVEHDSISGIPLSFCAKYIWNAMAMMGASVFENTAAASRQPDLCIIDDAAVSSRLQALLDMSTPQVALLLSARRILKREEHRDQAVLAPLTMERMLKEYESFRRGSISMGNSKLLQRAVCHLMQQGLLVPSIDHSGGGPLHYDVTKIYRDLDHYTLSRLPLQMPIDIDRELGKALEQNLLECPTALKEWGKSISKGS